MSSIEDSFVKILLQWFQKNKREFSWRRLDLTPFQQLVAELMLQKTGANQVEKVFPEFIITNIVEPASNALIGYSEYVSQVVVGGI